nr:DNA-directed DNA polymerase [Tanacetum cinerariifolium]
MPENKSKIAKLTHAVNQQASAVTTSMTVILKQFQATPPPAFVKAVEENCVICGGAHPYYQCLAAGGNTFLELKISKDTLQQPQLITIRVIPFIVLRPQGYNRGNNFNPKHSYQTPTQQNQVVPLSELEKVKRINEANMKAMQTQINNVKNKLRNEMKNLIQASMSNQTNELKNMMASFFQMNTASTLGSGSLRSNTVSNPKEEDERVEETLTDQYLAEYTIKVPPPLIQRSKPPSQRNFVMHQRDLLHPNIPYPSRMYKQKQVPLILGRPFLRTARALIDVHGEEMILCDGDERLTLNMRHDTSSYSNQPQKESINMINIYDDLSEDFFKNLFEINHQSGNTTFSSHLILTSSKVKDDAFNPEGGNVLPKKFLDLDSTKDLHPPHHINPLSGSTTSSSPNHLLEEFADELTLITFPLEYDDDLTSDIESDLKEIEYLLYHYPIKDMDSSLKDPIDQSNLDDLNDNLMDTIPEMFTDEHALDYSSPLLYDEYDDDLFLVESDTEYVYDDPFDSKGEKIKESKLLIDELDLPSDFLLSLEYDSFLSEDFSEGDAFPSTNNKDKIKSQSYLMLLRFLRILILLSMNFLSSKKFSGTDIANITKKWQKSDTIEHEIVKNAQKPDSKIFLCSKVKPQANSITRRSDRSRVPNIVEPKIRTIKEVVPMADRTMEELLQVPTEGYGEAIVIPKILAENFEIKTNLLQLVQTNKFHGFERDNPHTHISNFKRMTSTLKYRDVPNDAIKLMPFPYSLEGAARIWDSSSKTDDRIDKLADQISKLVEIVNKQVITPATAKAVEKTCVICGASTSSTLLSNTVPNPKGEMKAVTTRSGLAYEGPLIPTNSPLEKAQPKPNIPYPSRLNDQKLREKATNKMEKFFQIFHALHFDISFADALLLMLKFASTIKSLLTNKDKLFELVKVPLNENCSAMLPKKLPEKLGDPGKFLIPCDFPGINVCHALADLGASINLMPLSIWKKLSLPELTPTQMTLELADRSITHPKGVAEDVFVKVGKFHFHTDFVVVDFVADLRVPLILGRSFLRTGRALIDVYGEEITLRVNDESVTFNLNQTMRYYLMYDDNFMNRVDVIDISCEEFVQDVLDFQYNSKSSIPTLVTNPSFSKETKSKCSKEPIVKSSSPTLTLFEESDFFLEEIEDFLNDESIPTRIENSFYDSEGDILYLENPWVSPIHCVPKKGGMTIVANENNELIPTRLVTGWRVCIDYRKLNDATRKDHFSLPFMDQMLERLARNEFYCFLDGSSGYFQIPIDPETKRKQLSHALMELSFTVACPSAYVMLPEKCHFMCKKGIVLGHKISKSRIEVYRAKVDVIAKLPHPTTVKGVRIFLSHAGFYRRFIQDFSKIARPMTHLLEKETPFVFSKDCIDAFDTLKKKLTEAPILVVPDWNIPFKLMCDASDFVIGAYMLFEKFRPYLVLSKSLVYTDHSALKYLLSKQDAKLRLLRWILFLQEFDITIRDKKETLGSLSSGSTPWFADIANFHAGNFIKKGLTSQQKKKFFKDVKHYFWDDPYLF